MPILEILVVAFLILLNGFFAMAELAVVSSRRARLEQMADEGVLGAKATLRLIDAPTRFLSTVQVGITLIGVLSGAYSGATLAEPLGDALAGALGAIAYPLSVGIVVVAVTYLALVVGELVPKRIALNNPERIAAVVARFMTGLSVAVAPVVWVLRVSTEGVLKVLRVPDKPESTVTEEEVKRLIAEGARTGVFHTAERDMINGVLKLADRPVRSVMTPRVEVVWLDLDDPPETIRKKIADSGRSRFPAGRRGLEQLDGVVHTKDLLDRFARTGSFDIEGALRQPLVVHEGTTVLTLLEMFRENAVHMAVVVDEYGLVEGIVTPTDILIAIAGDLPETLADEADSATRRDDGSWLMDGMISIDEASRLLDRRAMRGDAEFETLAGFVLAHLGQLPRIGESFAWEGLRFEIVDVDGRRIDRVLISQAPPAESADSSSVD